MLPMDDIQAFRTGLAKDRARSPKRHVRLSSWTYRSRIRSISDASEDSLQGLRRGDLRKNSWVHIFTKFTSSTGLSPKITGGSWQTTTRLLRLSGWFASRIGQTSKLYGIFA